ncbi:uncharacterized protein LOC112553282 [Pomacea canaliculata]|uniref:uncharacterized protein LOC112553282 n=1 Tax=Pomacea canaliculata TaxID=400727 RepID=UPI000D735D20|nr:uncharacterized protein LOC112553282 [Pomacea canaliculata]
MSKRKTPAQSTLEEKVHGLSLQDVSLDTAAVSARLHFQGTVTYPLVPPVYHSSTYVLDKVEDFLGALQDGGAVYSRLSNFTNDSVECAINALEQGAGSLVFSSGMGAISAIFFAFLKAGDHVVCQNPVYSGTMDLLKMFASNFNVEVSWVKAGCSVDEYRKLVRKNTRMLFGETPCNPEMSILDLKEFGELGRSLDNVLTVVDGTFASPYLQQILKFGIDISVHSCTKYMGGHSDLIAGCLTTRTMDQWRLLKKLQTSMGACLSPHDGSLLLRGLKTLPLRMKKHSENAQKVAEFLENHPKVLRVRYPGLVSHPGHEVAKRQMTAFGGMIMADVAGGVAGGKAFAENLRVAKLAVSLGGVETILEHAYSMSHGPYLLSEEEIKEAGITLGMLRISIGIEDAQDIINDFEQALARIQV